MPPRSVDVADPMALVEFKISIKDPLSLCFGTEEIKVMQGTILPVTIVINNVPIKIYPTRVRGPELV